MIYSNYKFSMQNMNYGRNSLYVLNLYVFLQFTTNICNRHRYYFFVFTFYPMFYFYGLYEFLKTRFYYVHLSGIYDMSKSSTNAEKKEKKSVVMLFLYLVKFFFLSICLTMQTHQFKKAWKFFGQKYKQEVFFSEFRNEAKI